MELVILIAGLVAIAVTSQLAQRIGLAGPLILLGLGVIIGFLPQVSAVEVPPEIILEWVLPPLLFTTAVRMSVNDFRRDLITITALAVGLVAISAIVIGVVVHLLVPSIPLLWGVALGAVISPTDAVAISIAKRQGVSHRVITILEGEGLLNDATALVVLSSATAAALQSDAGGFDTGVVIFDFIKAVLIAVVIGLIAGHLGLWVRSTMKVPAADMAFSLAIPFIASVPTHALHGSGLVAAVAAGLVISARSPRVLSPTNRQFVDTNWQTVEFLLEGFVFLSMGLQAYGIITEVATTDDSPTVLHAALIALLLGAITIVLRWLFVAPMFWWNKRRYRRRGGKLERREEWMRTFEDRLSAASDSGELQLMLQQQAPRKWEARAKGMRERLEEGWRRLRRVNNDLAYYAKQPIGWRDSSVIVWAGMRGAVTLAAAQTLPLDTPSRAFLLLIALFVAAGSLAIQGLTLPLVIRLVKPLMAKDVSDEEEQLALMKLLHSAVKDSALAQVVQERREEALAQAREGGFGQALVDGQAVSDAQAGADAQASVGTQVVERVDRPLARIQKPLDKIALVKANEQVRAMALESIHLQREALLDARAEGAFSSQVIDSALHRLDNEEIMLSNFMERGDQH